jgi:hypothetical protein
MKEEGEEDGDHNDFFAVIAFCIRERVLHCLTGQMNSAQRRVVVSIYHHHQHVK